MPAMLMLLFVLLAPDASWAAKKNTAVNKNKDTDIIPEMVIIHSGWFDMGSDDETDPVDPGYDVRSKESPVHPVYVDDFWMGKYEVTFKQYDYFCKETGRVIPSDEGWGRGRRPVINVSWYDAQAYCEWLTNKTDRKYRLPTEAEWEYACRAGTTGVYYWGNEPSGKYANGRNEDTHPWPPDGYLHTAPVGSFPPNAYGLYDMLGNVHEWCLDYFHQNFYNYSQLRNPANPGGAVANRTVIRGASWRHTYELRSSYRGWWWRSEKGLPVLGFRVVSPLTF